MFTKDGMNNKTRICVLKLRGAEGSFQTPTAKIISETWKVVQKRVFGKLTNIYAASFSSQQINGKNKHGYDAQDISNSNLNQWVRMPMFRISAWLAELNGHCTAN